MDKDVKREVVAVLIKADRRDLARRVVAVSGRDAQKTIQKAVGLLDDALSVAEQLDNDDLFGALQDAIKSTRAAGQLARKIR